MGLMLILLAMGMLGSRGSLYRAARDSARAGQARALARAGLEDARVKLAYDLDFPPPAADDQRVYEYLETMHDPDSGRIVGSFLVRVDTRFRVEPYHLVQVRSVGLVGDRLDPEARATVAATLDLSPQDRTNPSLPNPDLFEVLRWQED